MLKKLFSYIGEYKKSTIISPIFIIIEVIFEMLIPTLMAVIIDKGLNKNDMNCNDCSYFIIFDSGSFGWEICFSCFGWIC